MRFITLLILCCSLAAYGNTDETRHSLEAGLDGATPQRQISILQQLVKDNIKQDPPYALQHANTLISLLESSNSTDKDYLEALQQLATLQVGQGLLDDAKANAEKLAAGAQQLAEHNRHIQSLKAQGVIARIQSDYDGALDYFQRAVALARQHGLPDAAVQVEYEIAIIYYFMGKHSDAIELLHSLQPKVEQANNQLLAGKVLNILGIVYANQARFEESLDVMLTALEI